MPSGSRRYLSNKWFSQPAEEDGLNTATAEARKGADLAASLGRQIRELRKVKGLTLAGLAVKIGKSVGYLSELERGRRKPSIGSLQDISDALGVHVGWFFQPTQSTDPKAARYIVRSENRRRLSYSGLGSTDYLGMTDYLLSANLGGKLALVMTRYAPGASSGDDLDRHEGEEAGFVHSGTLELRLGDRSYALRAGDSFSFPSDIAHKYANPGDEEAIVIFAITPVALHY